MRRATLSIYHLAGCEGEGKIEQFVIMQHSLDAATKDTNETCANRGRCG